MSIRKYAMSSASVEKRKSKPTRYKASALDALRASGMVGMFAGAPDLSSRRKRILKDKLGGKTEAAR
jgi:hypothetical protein